MAQQSNQANKQKKRYRSAFGEVVPGSVKETNDYLEVELQEGPGYTKRVRASFDASRKDLRDAIEKGGKILARGVLLGSNRNNNVYIGVNSINEPLTAVGQVHHVKHSGAGKQPFVGGYLVQEIQKPDGTSFTKGKPFSAFGEAAQALAGLKNGDRITAEARETITNNNKEGEERKFYEALQFVGTAAILGAEIQNAATTQPAATTDVTPEDVAAEGADAPLDEAAFQANTSDFDDDIPF